MDTPVKAVILAIHAGNTTCVAETLLTASSQEVASLHMDSAILKAAFRPMGPAVAQICSSVSVATLATAAGQTTSVVEMLDTVGMGTCDFDDSSLEDSDDRCAWLIPVPLQMSTSVRILRAVHYNSSAEHKRHNREDDYHIPCHCFW